MKTVSDVLRRSLVWVNPSHRIASVIVLMNGHDLGGLPVVEGGKLVGMVLHKHLLGIDAQRRV